MKVGQIISQEFRSLSLRKSPMVPLGDSSIQTHMDAINIVSFDWRRAHCQCDELFALVRREFVLPKKNSR